MTTRVSVRRRPPPHASDQHTLGHIDCAACEHARISQLFSTDMRGLRLLEAARLWKQNKDQTVSTRTAWDYETYLRPLREFFGALELRQIHIGHIVEYRAWRQQTAGPGRINHEVNTLQQLLAPAGLWEAIAKQYRPMKLPRSGPGQRVLAEELAWLLEVAQSKPRWRVAYLCALISASTAAGPSEILGLRLRDLNFRERQVSFIEGTKRDGERVRTVPMTDDCFWALGELERLAREKGSEAPEHYLIPHRADQIGGRPDPTRHMGSYKRAWYALRARAAKRYPRLAHVRRYDLRHTAATMMAENPDVDAPTLKKVLGHGPYSRLAIEHYFHESMERKRVAIASLEGLAPRRKPPVSEEKSAECGNPLLKKDYLQ